MLTLRFIVVALLLALGGQGAPSPANPDMTVIGATAQELRSVSWAVGRFAAVGLPLPDLRIEFSGDPEACYGFAGVHNHELGRVRICNRGTRFTPTPIQTLMHELVHGWADTYLAAEDKAAWTERRELRSWNDHEDPWWRRSQEQAAEIVSWGLLDDDTRIHWLLLEDCDQLRGDFEALTGSRPLNVSDASCKDDGTGNRRSDP